MKLEKEAERDAQRWLAAEMAYGEGAGVRRRHVGAEIETKMMDSQDYYDLFTQAYEALDKNKYAQLAIKERKSLDRAAKASKNLRALKSGNLNNLTTGVFVVVGFAYFAHSTGLDKKIEAEAKKLYKKARVEVKYRKARMEGRNVEKIIQ
jgi:hypothetical protein